MNESIIETQFISSIQTKYNDTLQLYHPLLAILLFLSTFFMELFYHHYHISIKQYLIIPTKYRIILPDLLHQINTLKRNINQYNSPATFVEYSKSKRALDQVEKKYEMISK